MSKDVSGIIGVSTADQGRFSVFYASLTGLARPDGTLSIFASGACIAENRNTITEQALKADADWILYLDDDHILKQDTLTRLLDTERDVISAHYIQRQSPFNPVAMDVELPDGGHMWKQLGPQEHGIISVKTVGAGCLLVRREVIEALDPPYWTLGQIHPSSWGDDLHFCQRVRAAGFDINMDLDNSIGHICTGVMWPNYHEKHGWMAMYSTGASKPPIAAFPMPLPGDPA